MKKFRSSIKTQMTAISLLIVVLSVSTISLILFVINNGNYRETTHEHKQEAVNQLQYSINAYLDELNRLTLTCMSNGYLLERLTDKEPKTAIEQLERSREIENFLDEIMITQREDILGVYLFLVDEQGVYASTRYQTGIDLQQEYMQLPWYEDVFASGRWLLVPPHFDEVEQIHRSQVFSLVRVIINPKTLAPVAVIKVNANTNVLDKLFDQIDVGKHGHLTEYPEADSWGAVDGTRYIFNKASEQSYGLRLFSYASTEDFDRMQSQQMLISCLVTLCCCFVALLTSFLFASKFLQPVLQMYNLMKQVENGNPNVRFTGTRTDEIGYLGQRFNSMLESVSQANEENTRLLTEIYEGKVLHSQAQMNALQAQIKPHFMCNTLNMISLLIQCGEQEAAVVNINRLSFLMRSITDFRETIPLERELSVLRAYLDIQKDRYGDRIQYKEEIDPALYNYMIPTLSLQPIVENAIVHGCEKSSAVTFLNIYSCILPNAVDIVIEDNACGMSQERLEEVKAALAENCSGASPDRVSGVGLPNIHNRLKLLYGENFGINISSQPGRGTKVVVWLPLKSAEGNEKQEET